MGLPIFIIPGRFPSCSYKQVDPTHWVTEIPGYDTISSITLAFLENPGLPPNTALTVYASPSTDATRQWLYIGHLSSTRPSTTIKITPHPTPAELILGLQLEPEALVVELEAKRLSPIGVVDNAVLNKVGMKLVTNLNNFMTSYAVSVPPPSQGMFQQPQQFLPPGEYIPVSAVAKWNEQVERRIRLNPHFWDELK